MSEFEHLLHRSAEVHSLNGTDRTGEQRTLSSGDEMTPIEEETGTGTHDNNGEEEEQESTNVHTNADTGIPFETDAEVIAVRLYHDGWASKRERRAVVVAKRNSKACSVIHGCHRRPHLPTRHQHKHYLLGAVWNRLISKCYKGLRSKWTNLWKEG